MADNGNNGDNGKVNPIQVQKFVGGIDYPVDKQELLDTAKENGADENVMKTLERLPEKTYDAPTDVTEEIGNFE